MDSKLHNLPPMKRFTLLHQETLPKTDPNPIHSPMSLSHLPTKKRKLSIYPPNSPEHLPSQTPTTKPYCLPAKKRIWAFPPDSPLSNIDLNVEYTPTLIDKIEEEEEDGVLCAVCESTDGDPSDPIVFCDGCELMVHSTCYGNPLISSIPEGDWFCEQCTFDVDKTGGCCLCPVIGGAMKPTNDGRWAHIVCALLVPEVFFEDSEGRNGIDCSLVPKRRWNGVCYLCKGKNGCVVECSEMKCTMSFHVSCGLKKDLCIELKEGRKRSNNNGGIVAAFCRKHTEIWEKQQQTGKFKIVARD